MLVMFHKIVSLMYISIKFHIVLNLLKFHSLFSCFKILQGGTAKSEKSDFLHTNANISETTEWKLVIFGVPINEWHCQIVSKDESNIFIHFKIRGSQSGASDFEKVHFQACTLTKYVKVWQCPVVCWDMSMGTPICNINILEFMANFPENAVFVHFLENLKKCHFLKNLR